MKSVILANQVRNLCYNQEDLDEVDKIAMGLGQSKIISARDKKMLAYHEGGHAFNIFFIRTCTKFTK